VCFTLFVILPLAASVGLSFTYFNILQPPQWVGWTNYRMLFADDDLCITALKNTLYFAIITGPVGYRVAFLFAWMIHQLKERIRAYFTTVFYIPSLTSGVAMAVVWLVIFANDGYGYLNSMLLTL